jgi:hypothetical protein
MYLVGYSKNNENGLKLWLLAVSMSFVKLYYEQYNIINSVRLLSFLSPLAAAICTVTVFTCSIRDRQNRLISEFTV